LLARRALRDVAAVVEPFGAALEAPLEPAGALVEAADEDEKVVRRGVDPGGEIDDRAVELVDRDVVIDERTGAQVPVHAGASLQRKEAGIISSYNGWIKPKSRNPKQFCRSALLERRGNGRRHRPPTVIAVLDRECRTALQTPCCRNRHRLVLGFLRRAASQLNAHAVIITNPLGYDTAGLVTNRVDRTYRRPRCASVTLRSCTLRIASAKPTAHENVQRSKKPTKRPAPRRRASSRRAARRSGNVPRKRSAVTPPRRSMR